MIAPMIYPRGVQYGFVVIVYVVGALCQPAPAQSNAEPQKTAGQWNGRFWTTLDTSGKVMFLNGYLEALVMVSRNAAKGSPETIATAVYWPSNLNAGEVRESLDRIYDTPENRPIPISDIVSLPISMRAAGADEQAVQKKIADLRAKTLIKP
jgi:hypothetical protein